MKVIMLTRPLLLIHRMNDAFTFRIAGLDSGESRLAAGLTEEIIQAVGDTAKDVLGTDPDHQADDDVADENDDAKNLAMLAPDVSRKPQSGQEDQQRHESTGHGFTFRRTAQYWP